MVTHISSDASHVMILKRRSSGRCRQAILASCIALAFFSMSNLVWADDSHKHRLISQQRVQDMKDKISDLREKVQDHKHHHNMGGGVPGSIQTLEARIAALETKVAAMGSFDPTPLLQAVQSLQNQVTTLDGKVLTLDGKTTTLDGKVLTAETRLGDVEKKMIPGLEKFVSINPNDMNGMKGPHLVLRGVNVHVQSGTGATADSTSGLGNLVVGYNEQASPDQVRLGAHNLVGGSQNGFSSYGGLVFGIANKVTGTYGSVVGGENNTASGISSSVLGGRTRSATWQNATSSAGATNPTAGF